MNQIEFYFLGVKNDQSDPPLLPFDNINDKAYAKATMYVSYYSTITVPVTSNHEFVHGAHGQ